MPPPKTRSRNILAFSNQSLAILNAQINQQITVRKSVKSVLHDELADHVIHCLLHSDSLVIYTDSSAWASQLRFYREAILSAGNFKKKALQVKVMPPLNMTYNMKKVAPKIPSENVINNIKTTGRDIDDERLSESLERLSTTLSRSKLKK